MILATLVLERDPLRRHDLLPAVFTWIQDSGGIAVLALIFYGAYYFLHRPTGPGGGTGSPLQKRLFNTAPFIAVIGYLAGAILWILPLTSRVSMGGLTGSLTSDAFLLGACGTLFAVLIPFLMDLPRLCAANWALSKLSFKEAIRRRVLWVFRRSFWFSSLLVGSCLTSRKTRSGITCRSSTGRWCLCCWSRLAF